MKASGIALVVSVFLLGVVCTLIFTLPQADTMPGTFVYTFKYFKENVQRIPVREPYERAVFDLDLAQRRIDEFEYAFNRTMPKYYERILLRYEMSLIRAANETSAAYDVADFCDSAMLVFEKHRYYVWDPPLQVRFEDARLTTVKARREAVTRISVTDQASAAQFSLHSAGYHLRNAVASGNPDLAEQPLVDYTGWLMYLRGLGLDLYNETENVVVLDQASRPYMYEHFYMLVQLNQSSSNITVKHAQNAINISSTLLAEMEARIAAAEVVLEEIVGENVTVAVNETPEIIRQIERASAVFNDDILIPSTLNVNFTKEVELSFTATDKSYAVKIESLGYFRLHIPVGTTTKIRFNATQKGRYPVRCVSWCTKIKDGDMVGIDTYGHVVVE